MLPDTFLELLKGATEAVDRAGGRNRSTPIIRDRQRRQDAGRDIGIPDDRLEPAAPRDAPWSAQEIEHTIRRLYK